MAKRDRPVFPRCLSGEPEDVSVVAGRQAVLQMVSNGLVPLAYQSMGLPSFFDHGSA